jgi:hypothetical protein
LKLVKLRQSDYINVFACLCSPKWYCHVLVAFLFSFLFPRNLFWEKRIKDMWLHMKMIVCYIFIMHGAGNVKYIWTSGRLCDFKGCDRPDLQPININGWFWTAELKKLPPTNNRAQNDWSETGG